MKLPNLSERENRFFYIAVIVVGALICEALIIEPLLTKWRKFDEKISADKLKLEWADKVIAKKAFIASDYEKTASTVRMAGSEEEETAEFLSEIESLANSSGVHINEIRPLPIKRYELYIKFYADIALEGEMVKISDLMRRIEASEYLLSVQKLSLSSKQSAETNLLVCHIVISKIAVLK